MQPAPATTGQRLVTYLVDVIPAIILAVLTGWIPIIGGVVLASYWLLRDVTGASLGKLLLGLRVRKRDGSEIDAGSRVLRNVTIALGPSLLIIPLLGYALAPPVACVLILIETIMLLTQGERLGDKFAGTAVFRAESLVA
jgi:uncharacterized RDD family membrane protein YckC